MRAKQHNRELTLNAIYFGLISEKSDERHKICAIRVVSFETATMTRMDV